VAREAPEENVEPHGLGVLDHEDDQEPSGERAIAPSPAADVLECSA
jgi:hypothetical protein